MNRMLFYLYLRKGVKNKDMISIIKKEYTESEIKECESLYKMIVQPHDVCGGNSLAEIEGLPAVIVEGLSDGIAEGVSAVILADWGRETAWMHIERSGTV